MTTAANARAAGRRAFRDGLQTDDNPYSVEALANAWEEGWWAEEADSAPEDYAYSTRYGRWMEI